MLFSLRRRFFAQKCMEALQLQVSQHFGPECGMDCDLHFVGLNDKLPTDPKYWQLVVLNDSDTAGALGYHDLTAAGNPLGKVFAKTDILYNSAWTVTASHELCLTGDTRIRLLDGTRPTIKELVDHKEFWVYAVKPNGEMRPGCGHSVRQTGKSVPILKVKLDNGKVIRCTPDHPFIMRDGCSKEAGDLQLGDSLMPLYTKMKVLDRARVRKGMYEYEHVYIPSSKKWVPTHRMVVPFCSAGYVRHHKDFSRNNNSPDNIQVMKWQAHQKLHAKHIVHYLREFQKSGRKRNISDEARQMWAERGRARFLKYNGSEKHKEAMARYWGNPANRRKQSVHLREWARSPENIKRVTALLRTPRMRAIFRNNMIAYNKSDAHKKVASKIGKKAMMLLRTNPVTYRRMVIARSRANKKRWAQPIEHERAAQRGSYYMHIRWHEKRNEMSLNCEHCTELNHKVVSVNLAGRSNVYNLTVDKYHTFALDAGVFVHNCEMLGDSEINKTTFAQDSATTGTLFAYETADACEDDQFGYKINDVLVSDFLLPSYFVWWQSAPKYDWMGHIKDVGNKPGYLTLLPGGYYSIFKVTKTGGSGWQQVNAQAVPEHKMLAPTGSRREKRIRGQQNWVRSTDAAEIKYREHEPCSGTVCCDACGLEGLLCLGFTTEIRGPNFKDIKYHTCGFCLAGIVNRASALGAVKVEFLSLSLARLNSVALAAMEAAKRTEFIVAKEKETE